MPGTAGDPSLVPFQEEAAYPLHGPGHPSGTRLGLAMRRWAHGASSCLRDPSSYRALHRFPPFNVPGAPHRPGQREELVLWYNRPGWGTQGAGGAGPSTAGATAPCKGLKYTRWPRGQRRGRVVARAGPALHRPPLITFSGPLPAGTDNAGGAFEVRKGCRGGSRANLFPPPILPGEGASRTKPGAGHSRAPKTRETKGKQTGLEPGARCCVCPPPRRARMMDGCSQLARPPGRPRYLHNTGVPPVTSDTALPGAEAQWPPRFLQPLEDWDSL